MKHFTYLWLVCALPVAATASAAPMYHLTTLAAFNGANGRYPVAGLIADASGNLYGTTRDGGDLTLHGGLGIGTVFELAAGTHSLTTLAKFKGTNGYQSYAGLVADSSGNFYGTTAGGGAGGLGTVFKLDAGTYAFSTLIAFNGTNGAIPFAGLIVDAAGNLFGTTSRGGANDFGTVFKVAAGTHALSTLATFDGANGREPHAGLLADASGNLFGTTLYGGAGGWGTVFELAAGTQAISTLVAFNGADGQLPNAGLIADSGGNLYGTTQSGGAGGNGTVFQLAAGTHTLSTLVAFDGANGAIPYAGLIADASGNLYGTTKDGGDLMLNKGFGYGTVFRVAAGTHVLNTLATFNGANGRQPYAALLADANGSLYGTTLGGGVGGGIVFQLSPVPEPSTFVLAAAGALGLVSYRWRTA